LPIKGNFCKSHDILGYTELILYSNCWARCKNIKAHLTRTAREENMESLIVRNLQPEFAPVAVVWSNTIPNDTLQFKKDKFGCILYLFAEASRRGKVAGASRESITCNGGRAALGLGLDFDTSDEQLDRFAAVFSKGKQSVSIPGRNRSCTQKLEILVRIW